MAGIDKLVIEITGDASGLTKALGQAQKNLTAFNTGVTNGNKAINSLVAAFNKGSGAAQRLATTMSEVKSNFTGLNRNVTSTAGSIERLGNSAKAANSDIKSFASQLSKLASSFERISGASKSATAAINSLQRRVAALSTTVSATNASMRGFNRTVQMGTEGASRGGIIVNNYGRAVEGAGGTARRTTSAFGGLNRANVTLMEGFRRHVAQITALRTLTYQAIFWFSPLVYSIIKVNAQYEKQMQLLKNLSGQTTEMAKTQWALNTRQQLVQLANTNPFSLDQITESFVRMKVSGLDPLNGGLQTLMDSISAFGGGNDELQRAGIALQQMVGKSAVSMEELRQQLGEHIPDAMRAMAEGMGVSMADFYKKVQHGTVESRTAIHNMLVVLNQDHRGAAANMMLTWNGMLARLGTAWQNFVAKLEHHPGRNTFIDTLKANLQQLMVFLNSPAGTNFAISVEQGLASAAKAIANLIKLIYEWRTQIIAAAKIFAIMWGGKLVLGTITSFATIFAQGLRIVILLVRSLMGATTAYTLLATRMAAAVRSVAIALGVAATAGEAAALSIGALVTRMLGAVGIAIALAGAVWLIVRALNAQTDAQKNANLAKEAKQGRAWEEDSRTGVSKERDSEKQRLTNLKQEADLYRTGGYTVNSEGKAVYVPKDIRKANQKESEYNYGAHAFNLKNANTRNARQSMVDTEFEQSQPDPYASTRSKYNDLRAKINPNDKKSGEQSKKLREQEALELQQDTQNDIQRLQGLKKTADPQTKAAIDKLIERRQADLTSYEDPFVKQEYIQNNKDKKKKKKRNPLEGSQNRFANTYVATADLEHQYKDLVNGTSTEFDAEAAQKEGERLAGLFKTKEALKLATAAEKARQEEIRKSIKVEQAIHDIEDKRKDTEAQIAEGLDELKTSYNSITLESQHYKEALDRQYRTELQVVESRMATGKANDDEIRQYVRLKEAINGAVRAKQAELVVEAAKDAKSANEDYYATLRSPIQQADYEANQEHLRYADALKVAIGLANNEKQVDEELASAKAQLEAALHRQAEATDAASKSEQDAIIVSAKRTIAQDEETLAARDSIPYLQERLRILDQEAEIRHKWNGAAGPALDWAKKAAGDFNDLGASMGSVLTGAMDDFVNSLADGKMAFKDFAKTVLKQLLLIIIRGLIAKAIMSALGLGLGYGSGSDAGMGGDFGAAGYTGGEGFAPGIAHTGGIAGSINTTRSNVHPAIFSFAERYHTGGLVGLTNNEVPIIAERGEGVFTKEQMKAMGETNKGSNVQVNVINQTGVQADVQRDKPKFDGEKWVETIILKKIATAGPVRNALLAGSKR